MRLIDYFIDYFDRGAGGVKAPKSVDFIAALPPYRARHDRKI
jgi:hypothetical protein